MDTLHFRNCLKTEIENFFDCKFPGQQVPKFFVGYKFQTLKIERMKPIESQEAFWEEYR